MPTGYSGSSVITIGGGGLVTLKTYSTTQGTITGAIDGVNDTFVMATALDLTTGVLFINGLLAVYGTDYTVAGDTITTTVPPANIVGKNITAHGEEV